MLVGQSLLFSNRICILQGTGLLLIEVLRHCWMPCYRFGDYGNQYKKMLAEPDEEEQWDVFRAFEGSFPTDDVAPEYDCIVLTGSK